MRCENKQFFFIFGYISVGSASSFHRESVLYIYIILYKHASVSLVNFVSIRCDGTNTNFFVLCVIKVVFGMFSTFKCDPNSCIRHSLFFFCMKRITDIPETELNTACELYKRFMWIHFFLKYTKWRENGKIQFLLS